MRCPVRDPRPRRGLPGPVALLTLVLCFATAAQARPSVAVKTARGSKKRSSGIAQRNHQDRRLRPPAALSLRGGAKKGNTASSTAFTMKEHQRGGDDEDNDDDDESPFVLRLPPALVRTWRRGVPGWLKLALIAYAGHVVLSEGLVLAFGEWVAEGILALNGLVFCLWHLSLECVDKDRQIYESKFMEKHFLCSTASVAGLVRAPHTMVLSTFSHVGLDHLTSNLCTLWSFTPAVIEDIGPLGYARLFSAGTFLSCLLPAYLRHHRKYQFRVHGRGQRPPSNVTRGLGASGAISALIAWVCLRYPNAPTTLAMPGASSEGQDDAVELSVPLALWGIIWLCKDVQGASGAFDKDKTDNDGKDKELLGYDAHIGGAIAGAYYYLLTADGGCLHGIAVVLEQARRALAAPMKEKKRAAERRRQQQRRRRRR